ncbi:MAG: HAD family phosphatase [Deltaproteobacteria bacterium]|nr:HAD family phosphatase [Deltaproteobacteria bacterium]
MPEIPEVKAVLLDFGGVVAEEGFKNGLHSIALDHGLDPDIVISTAFKITYEIGFVLGKVREDAFWRAMRNRFPFRGEDRDLTEQILSRFILRLWMLHIASDLKAIGMVVGILSDQCHWLEELDQRHGFFRYFDHIFNSYHLHISKKDPEIFDMISQRLHIDPANILFVDDHEAHILRARQKGLQTILYENKASFIRQLTGIICGTLEIEICLPSLASSVSE